MIPKEQVWIDYTNHRGERAFRRIHPLRLSFENNEWHHDSQWLIEAMDMEKSAVRTFSLSTIHDWFSIAEVQTAEGLLREKVSPSYLQRSMKIGWDRASKLIDMFEKRGLISEKSDSGIRIFLATAV